MEAILDSQILDSQILDSQILDSHNQNYSVIHIFNYILQRLKLPFHLPLFV